MLTTYDRYMREFRLKRLEIKLEREQPQDEREVVPAVHVALIVTRQAVKDTFRAMEGHA